MKAKTQLPHENGKNTKKRMIEVAKTINEIRAIQNWQILEPDDVLPIAEVWIKQLDRNNVPTDRLEKLVALAVDRRSELIRKGSTLPAFDVELILAMNRTHYPPNAFSELSFLEHKISQIRELIERLELQNEQQDVIDQYRDKLEKGEKQLEQLNHNG